MEQVVYSEPSNKSPSNKEFDSKNQHEVRKLIIPKNISARIDKDFKKLHEHITLGEYNK